MSENELKTEKPLKYEKPALMDLTSIDMAAGQAVCNRGSQPGQACNGGVIASGHCNNGLIAGNSKCINGYFVFA